MNLPSLLQDLIEQLSRIPGIGPKSAMRHSLFLSTWPEQELKRLASSLQNLNQLHRCVECGLFCDGEVCEICRSPERLMLKTICVVENFNDVMAVENSGTFKGLYHVLGGVLNPLLGVGPDELNVNRLVHRAKALSIESVILAVNPSVEGDATCSYLRSQLENIAKIERIGLGIPVGGSLEYLDSLTIAKALENRTSL